ncbi:MAG: ParB N-terminal domain-containing protein [Alistipes senegalensis]|nr:ParB N-terminal domain-containing protein [Alistipes senegalensis]
MFDLNSFLATPTAMQNAVRQIPCEMLRPYHNHRFELYTGERLDDMVASIKANGVLSPIVVQPCENGYEILIGHNRWNASQIAEIPTIPAIIKEGLSEQEAEIYVIESNLIQRGFDNLKISEQASVIALRHNEMFSQGKRNDIIRELQMLENPTSRPVGEKLNSAEILSEEYSMSSRNISRFLRIDKLIFELKGLVDSGKIAVRSGVELSYLSEETQLEIADLSGDYAIDMKKAKLLRESADENGNVKNSDIIRILDGKKIVIEKSKSVKISNDTFSRYFEPSAKPKQVAETIEKALEFYFKNIQE